jgi:hypothetical protein
MRAAALALLASSALAVNPAWAPKYRDVDIRGLSVLSEAYAPNQFPYSSPEAASALKAAFDAMGPSHVRLAQTYYMASQTATDLYAKNNTISPIYTATSTQVKSIVAAARNLGLKVALTVNVDFDYDIADNVEGLANTTTAAIGTGFTSQEWDAWFSSYTAAVTATIATATAAGGVDMLEVGYGLDNSYQQAASWKALIATARGMLPPSTEVFVSTSADSVGSVTWWEDSSFISITNAPNLTAAPNSSATGIMEAWGPTIDALSAASAAAGGKRVLVSGLGFQSRPNAWQSPMHQTRPDFSDCSGWLECYDMTAQEQALEGSFRILAMQSWFAGAFVQGVNTDPSSGGTSDDGASPMGKPAAAVVGRWFRNMNWAAIETFPGEGAIIAAVAAAATQSTASADSGARGADIASRADAVGMWNGFVFGGPDEWSSPYYRYDSAGARASIDQLVATKANAVQLVIMGYYTSDNSTLVYSISNLGSSLRTSTGPELLSIAAYAKSKGLRIMVSPMIDPDYDLPGNCRQCATPPGPGWRGTVGQDWGQDCSAGSQWAQWHTTYASTTVLPAARLAQAMGADAFLVAHELQVPVEQCPDLWTAMIQSVRDSFTGLVSVAFNHPVVDHWKQSQPWISTLDFIGVDCYFGVTIPHSTLQWQDVNASVVRKAWEVPAAQLAKLASDTSLPIVCTEIGSQSRPWSYSSVDPDAPPGHEFGEQTCNVWDQCHSNNAQALMYDGMLSALYAESWFRGFTLWMWRADPTAGGPSDDAFTPAGKPASIAVLQRFWATK